MCVSLVSFYSPTCVGLFFARHLAYRQKTIAVMGNWHRDRDRPRYSLAGKTDPLTVLFFYVAVNLSILARSDLVCVLVYVCFPSKFL
jgi:hypothetical protein